MEKILLAIDSKNLNTASLDFACYLGRLTASKVTGIFLENMVAEQHPVVKSSKTLTYIDWELEENTDEYTAREKLVQKNIAYFKDACERRSVSCAVHRDRGVPASEIVAESRFADLLVIDAETSFNKTYEGCPTEFVKDILARAECPVIIAPQSFEGIDEVILTYNGTASSVFAIKQFTYLFPELADKKTIILQVNKSGEWYDPDKYNFKEWLQYHYSAIGFEALKGDTEDKLFDYLFKRKNVLTVMGAYGRSAASRFFKHSPADLLIRTVTQPIFISHI